MLKKMTEEEMKQTNGGGAIFTAVKLFFKIVFTPTNVY